MKKLIKRTIACTLAVIMAASTCLSAGAYSPENNWSVQYYQGDALNYSKRYCNTTVTVWGKGYQTYCANITGANNRYVNVEIMDSTFFITTTGYSAIIPYQSSYSGVLNVSFTAMGSICIANGSVGQNK